MTTRADPRRRLAIALLVAAGALTAPAAAEATIVRMTDQGLFVDARADDNPVNNLSIGPGERTAERSIVTWEISALGCTRPEVPGGPPCVDPEGDDCRLSSPSALPFGHTVICERRVPGVIVAAGAGDDRVALFTEGDGVSITLGSGRDELVSLMTFCCTPPDGRWTIDGGSGGDTIEGSTGGNTVEGGSGNDTIRTFPSRQGVGGSDTDVPQPNASGNDRINGGDGDDRINPGFGDDVVTGGSGDDRFDPGGDRLSFSGDAFDAFDGGPGFDRIDYSARGSRIFFNSGATESGSTQNGERDRVSRVEHAILGRNNDIVFSLIETLSRRRYEGRGGNDDLRGHESDDTIIGGAGRDRMSGFSGDDVIDARDNGRDESISCGRGDDVARLDNEDPAPRRSGSDRCERVSRS